MPRLTSLRYFAYHLTSACFVLAAAATPATAQQRLFVRSLSEVVELDPRPASLGGVVRRFPLPTRAAAWATQDAVSLDGGRLLAWTTSYGEIALLNTYSGAVQQFAIPGFVAERVVGSDGNRRLVVHGNAPGGAHLLLVADARSGAYHLLPIGTVWPWRYQIAYAHETDLLFVARQRSLSDTFHDIDVIHAGTGTVVKTLDVWPFSVNQLITDAAGTRLWVSDSSSGTLLVDVSSGRALASGPTLPAGDRPVVLDEYRRRLIADVRVAKEDGIGFGVSAAAADSLQSLATVRLPELPLGAPTEDSYQRMTQNIDVSSLSATLFVLQAVEEREKYGHYMGCHDSQLVALDAHTGQVRQAVNMTNALGSAGCRADLVRITEPSPPTTGTVNVAEHRVTLEWQAPFGATHYELEAGTAPGLANIGRITLTDPRFALDGVPSGTYYLRVRAVNTIGKSAASPEIQVIVP